MTALDETAETGSNALRRARAGDHLVRPAREPGPQGVPRTHGPVAYGPARRWSPTTSTRRSCGEPQPASGPMDAVRTRSSGHAEPRRDLPREQSVAFVERGVHIDVPTLFRREQRQPLRSERGTQELREDAHACGSRAELLRGVHGGHALPTSPPRRTGGRRAWAGERTRATRTSRKRRSSSSSGSSTARARQAFCRAVTT